MLYVAIGCALLALLVWAGRARRPVLKRREWRFLSAAAALVAFTAAAITGLRGAWGSSIVLVVLGLWLVTSTRPSGAPAQPSPGRMSEAEARSILGVGPEAGASEIQTAYARLMRLAHPDKGGTDGLAAQLNAARDRLLKG